MSDADGRMIPLDYGTYWYCEGCAALDRRAGYAVIEEGENDA